MGEDCGGVYNKLKLICRRIHTARAQLLRDYSVLRLASWYSNCDDDDMIYAIIYQCMPDATTTDANMVCDMWFLIVSLCVLIDIESHQSVQSATAAIGHSNVMCLVKRSIFLLFIGKYVYGVFYAVEWAAVVEIVFF